MVAAAEAAVRLCGESMSEMTPLLIALVFQSSAEVER
jgi:hypothetical protein